ncbi:hypothetical protein D3C76_1291310 [compost metagenome]
MVENIGNGLERIGEILGMQAESDQLLLFFQCVMELFGAFFIFGIEERVHLIGKGKFIRQLQHGKLQTVGFIEDKLGDLGPISSELNADSGGTALI